MDLFTCVRFVMPRMILIVMEVIKGLQSKTFGDWILNQKNSCVVPERPVLETPFSTLTWPIFIVKAALYLVLMPEFSLSMKTTLLSEFARKIIEEFYVPNVKKVLEPLGISNAPTVQMKPFISNNFWYLLLNLPFSFIPNVFSSNLIKNSGHPLINFISSPSK